MHPALRISSVLISYALVIAVSVILYNTMDGWQDRYELCPAKNHLSWDGNLRFTRVHDSYQDITHADGNGFLSVAADLFSAPTWPPLRWVLSLTLALISGNPPDPVTDTYISTAFFFLLFPSLLYILFRIVPSKIEASLLWSVVSLLLMTTYEIAAYAFSAMLETQGMFFFVWSMYYLYRAYSGELTTWYRTGLVLLTLGLTLTKYPYGIMLILCLIILELIRNPAFIWRYLTGPLWNRYAKWKAVLLILYAAAAFALSVAGPLAGTRTGKLILYSAIVILFIDFTVFAFRNREQFRVIHRVLYACVLLPSLGFFFVHPDRFTSFLSAGLHVQDANRIFISSLFREVFAGRLPIALFLGSAFTGFAVLTIIRFLMFRDKASGLGRRGLYRIYSRIVRKPYVSVALVTLFSFLLLEMATDNKQLRHIYHLLPAMICFLFLPFLEPGYRKPEKRPESVERKNNRLIVLKKSAAYAVLILLLFILPGRVAMAEKKFPVCFSGIDREVFALTGKLAKGMPSGNLVIENEFHNVMSTSPVRPLASDIDLMIRLNQRNSYIRHDSSYKLKTWEKFDYFILITDRCYSEDYKTAVEPYRNRFIETGIQPESIEKIEGNSDACAYAVKIAE